LPDLTLILLSAGNSTRFNQKVKKQWIRIEDDPLWLFVVKRFESFYNFKDIIITSNENELFYMKKHAPYIYVRGGDSRQESLNNALNLVKTPYVMVSDVARSCVGEDIILEMVKNHTKADIIVPYLDVTDTVVYEDKTINRDFVKLIQTPQLSKTDILKKALSSKTLYTDDSTAIKAVGGEVFYIKGSQNAKKITRYDDLSALECLKAPLSHSFVGHGFDVHRFCEDKEMVLCGVTIDSDVGFEAHSDGDVALHALIDALLGAIGASDIGELYPDTDDKHKDANSLEMLKEVVLFVNSVGFEIVNVDITVMAQKPKISSYKDSMREVVSKALGIKAIKTNIKATTTEKLGFIGRGEGVAVEAVASLKYINWK
jgi:2-C-methyl-D-erythritol 4-phosphate cytidylyltransferase/2-C-methyl-D-erythritol 2,4-cyclodiphosphate synthase